MTAGSTPATGAGNCGSCTRRCAGWWRLTSVRTTPTTSPGSLTGFAALELGPLALQAAVGCLNLTSWQVDDIDEVGRGGSAMLKEHPERHIWGLGRHHAGSNFFWYLKDPAGNFSEYYSDLDCIVDDYRWTPETFEGAQGLFNWGPPPPPSVLAPDDLAALMP